VHDGNGARPGFDQIEVRCRVKPAVRRLAGLSRPRDAQSAPHPPQEQRNRQPCECRQRERPGGSVLCETPNHRTEDPKGDAAKSRACCVERRCVLAALFASQSLFLLPFALMLFDKRGARDEKLQAPPKIVPR
jgi:hypothetical protein